MDVPTDVLRMTIWQTPAGIVDEGGMVLQAWLNFGITLIAPPANGLMHVGHQHSHCLPSVAGCCMGPCRS